MKRWFWAATICVALGAVGTAALVRAAAPAAAGGHARARARAASRTAPGAELFYRQLPAGLRVPASGAGRQILAAYGAMFVARGVRLPPVVMFPNAAACSAWQSRVPQLRRRLYGHWVDLQVRPMQALLAAEQAARRRGLKIIPRGHGASRRDYAGTVSLWRSRVNPGLRYWVARRRLSPLRAAAIRRMPIGRQVGLILELQTQGMFFSLGESKNILYSVAAPGSSQHIAMLALDVQDTASPELRRILEAHGWFQTVISDTPHFTYLGVPRSELPSLGLKRVLWGGRPFWVPNLGLPGPPA